MAKYTITVKSYSGTFIGAENFKATARAILQDNGLSTADFFKLKTVEDYKKALKKKGYEVIEERTVYDEAKDEAPYLGKYIDDMENADNKIPAGVQITKIKIGKDEKNVTVLYQKNGSKSSKEVTFKGYDDAIDDFIIAFRSMSEHIISTLDFPEEWLPRMTTTGLSITWKGDAIMGMVITAQLEIEGLNAPFNLNTPFIQVYSYWTSNDSCEDVCFSTDCENQLDTIIAYAKRYMNGETSSPVQTKMQFKG